MSGLQEAHERTRKGYLYFFSDHNSKGANLYIICYNVKILWVKP